MKIRRDREAGRLWVSQEKYIEKVFPAYYVDQSKLMKRVLKISMEELKIKDELELKVEEDLEEEIKDGIYSLALKLHRLYQHKKKRAMKLDDPKKQVSEVNINIKMQGGTTIEIKEMKRGGGEGRSCLSPIPTQNPNPPPTHRPIKFDWSRSLRSSSNMTNVYQGIKSGPNSNSNSMRMEGNQKHCKKDKSSDLDTKTTLEKLELGWKY
ncbi:uncharacterized protein LOC127260260 [Andrographis paniculata]|uniref:uncharacterized protein LOC127260260 n=1 Tax=Andrographis paniculata TaxID=175694 RepID=UPI0021E7B1DD|nr:uncharacterized protein LOC127260260 [Andrographis paniculata]